MIFSRAFSCLSNIIFIKAVYKTCFTHFLAIHISPGWVCFQGAHCFVLRDLGQMNCAVRARKVIVNTGCSVAMV